MILPNVRLAILLTGYILNALKCQQLLNNCSSSSVSQFLNLRDSSDFLENEKFHQRRPPFGKFILIAISWFRQVETHEIIPNSLEL